MNTHKSRTDNSLFSDLSPFVLSVNSISPLTPLSITQVLASFTGFGRLYSTSEEVTNFCRQNVWCYEHSQEARASGNKVVQRPLVFVPPYLHMFNSHQYDVFTYIVVTLNQNPYLLSATTMIVSNTHSSLPPTYQFDIMYMQIVSWTHSSVIVYPQLFVQLMQPYFE